VFDEPRTAKAAEPTETTKRKQICLGQRNHIKWAAVARLYVKLISLLVKVVRLCPKLNNRSPTTRIYLRNLFSSELLQLRLSFARNVWGYLHNCILRAG